MIGFKRTDADGSGGGIVVERGVASMARARSLQSRLSSALAMLLCAGLGVGLLIWYYGGILARHRAALPARQGAVAPVAADSSLPPLGPLRDLKALLTAVEPQVPASSSGPIAESLPLPPVASALSGVNGSESAPPASPHQTPLERRLAGPAFAGAADPAVSFAAGPGALSDALSSVGRGSQPAERTGGLAELLNPTVMPMARASELASQRLLLAKGAFIDCTLETAIDSSLPGMTTCITATDTFSVDGKVVLLERGSKLIGETRGEVQQGSSRLFVLWTEARTPTGVVVPLASPGTDALGRSGLDGEVERHFWQRFGAAILISVVDAAAQAAQHSGGSGTIIYDTSSSQGVATEALRGTIGIGPTITKNQGDRIQILVARDLDFRQVYQLRESEALHRQ